MVPQRVARAALQLDETGINGSSFHAQTGQFRHDTRGSRPVQIPPRALNLLALTRSLSALRISYMISALAVQVMPSRSKWCGVGVRPKQTPPEAYDRQSYLGGWPLSSYFPAMRRAASSIWALPKTRTMAATVAVSFAGSVTVGREGHLIIIASGVSRCRTSSMTS